ncbi:related to Ribonuclease H2 subunit A [Zygosaccharomyces bailii]|nr:related to Ribonuclease H2 subunit A [Zygosaccharomyces bailii]
MSTPPTVSACEGSLHSKSYFSPVPATILNSEQPSPVILGVDEAGRGPVLGPMVYGISYCTREYQDTVLIPNYGFDDSKKLTDPVRRALFAKMYNDGDSKAEIDAVGFAVTVITPADISSGMLRYPPSSNYNLNEQAHDVTMALIEGVLQRGVKLDHVYVDTVGPPTSYQRKLEQRFPGIRFTVAKKADSLYCVVSVASVVAKVTRDLILEGLAQAVTQDHGPLGSGYPADARTTAWLRASLLPLLGWDPRIARFSWQTCQTLLDANGIEFVWEEQLHTKPVWASKGMLGGEQPLTLDSWFGEGQF